MSNAAERSRDASSVHFFTRRSQPLHAELAETKRSTKHLHFMALEFGITYLQKYQQMFRMPVLNILQNYFFRITQYHILVE